MTSKGPKKMGEGGGRCEAGEGGLLLLMARGDGRLSPVAGAAAREKGSNVVLVVGSRGSNERASQLPDLCMLLLLVRDLGPWGLRTEVHVGKVEGSRLDAAGWWLTGGGGREEDDWNASRGWFQRCCGSVDIGCR